MTWLYTDTTNHVVLGILSEKLEWLEYLEIFNQKSTADLHFLINEMLIKHKLNFETLTGYLFAAGPGSYTGMRVSEGIAQVLEWQNINVYSFYHYEIPRIIEGSAAGIWFSDAFKGEYFLFNCITDEIELVSKEMFITRINDLETNVYTHFKNDHIYSLVKSPSKIILTGERIKNIPQEIFSQIVSRKKRVEPLYYRSEDKEFIPAKK
ncbi:MAG: hypothetical protein A2328_06375 [Bdellovibrionales bacterium RIFOXYB2_FULL_36_6]|nr:MAG: hypothetical protein A2328_06375 [Bdellovibrionales bacterium RIFOXYB2_FULL_36_6]